MLCHRSAVAQLFSLGITASRVLILLFVGRRGFRKLWFERSRFFERWIYHEHFGDSFAAASGDFIAVGFSSFHFCEFSAAVDA